MADEERRRQRREIRLLQQESVWMQKVLFALRKVEDVRDRIADLRDEEADELTLPLDGRQVTIGEIEDAVEDRVKALLEGVRERRGRIR